MDALRALHTRNSVPLLQEPAPNQEQLENIIQAGLRANDHMRLRPWKFFIIEGDSREKLGALMLDITLRDNPEMNAEQQRVVAEKPLRAPLIIMVVARLNRDACGKVPEIEQLISAGGAAQLMMAAAHAQGVGAVWRTGAMVYDQRFRDAVGLGANDRVVGMLYMGAPRKEKPLLPMVSEDFVEYWPK